jgi:hypothetical protein
MMFWKGYKSFGQPAGFPSFFCLAQEAWVNLADIFK